MKKEEEIIRKRKRDEERCIEINIEEGRDKERGRKSKIEEKKEQRRRGEQRKLIMKTDK